MQLYEPFNFNSGAVKKLNDHKFSNHRISSFSYLPTQFYWTRTNFQLGVIASPCQFFASLSSNLAASLLTWKTPNNNFLSVESCHKISADTYVAYIRLSVKNWGALVWWRPWWRDERALTSINEWKEVATLDLGAEGRLENKFDFPWCDFKYKAVSFCESGLEWIYQYLFIWHFFLSIWNDEWGRYKYKH